MSFLNALLKILSLSVGYFVIKDSAPEFRADFSSDGMCFPLQHRFQACRFQ